MLGRLGVALHGLVLATPEDTLPVSPWSESRPAAYELTWRAPAPPECPSEESLHEFVQALLAGALTGSGSESIEASVERRQGGYRLDVSVTFRGVTEQIEFPSAEACEELGRSLALFVALTLDPRAAIDPRENPDPTRPPESTGGSRDPSAAAEPAPEVALVSERELSLPEKAERSGAGPGPPVTRPTPGRPSVRGTAGLGAGLEVGMLGVPTAGVRATLGLVWPRARLDLRGLYAARRVVESNGAQVALQAWAIELAGCARFSWRSADLAVCGGAEAGQSLGRSISADPGRLESGPWFGPTAGLVARWISGRWALRGDAAVAAPLGRTRYFVNGALSTTPLPVSFRGLLSAEFTFGATGGDTRTVR